MTYNHWIYEYNYLICNKELYEKSLCLRCLLNFIIISLAVYWFVTILSYHYFWGYMYRHFHVLYFIALYAMCHEYYLLTYLLTYLEDAALQDLSRLILRRLSE